MSNYKLLPLHSKKAYEFLRKFLWQKILYHNGTDFAPGELAKHAVSEGTKAVINLGKESPLAHGHSQDLVQLPAFIRGRVHHFPILMGSVRVIDPLIFTCNL